jgi:hypothetical protein
MARERRAWCAARKLSTPLPANPRIRYAPRCLVVLSAMEWSTFRVVQVLLKRSGRATQPLRATHGAANTSPTRKRGFLRGSFGNDAAFRALAGATSASGLCERSTSAAKRSDPTNGPMSSDRPSVTIASVPQGLISGPRAHFPVDGRVDGNDLQRWRSSERSLPCLQPNR